MTDPTRVPVVIGVGDLRSGRAGAPADPREPLDLIHEATLAAIADTGADLATRIDTIHAIKTASWDYDDLPGLLAERLGHSPDDRLVILSCDDLGSCHAANVGVFRAIREGVARCSFWAHMGRHGRERPAAGNPRVATITRGQADIPASPRRPRAQGVAQRPPPGRGAHPHQRAHRRAHRAVH